ncbi:MAG TPA: lipopolysaccharide biosynthesis protein [Candidatus Dormibacteraeota bacterium]
MTIDAGAPLHGSLGARLWARASASRLVRQNLVLFVGGMLAGVGGFVYHLIAARLLGPALYGEVASLVSAYLVGNGATFVITLVLARYAATLEARGSSSALHHLMVRTSKLLVFPSLVALALLGVLAPLGASFLHLNSWVPVLWMLLAMVMIWQVGVPRGMLQGMQRFGALSVNQSVEMVFRVGLLAILLVAGFGVVGSMVAVVVGAAVGYSSGMYTLRDILRVPGERVRLRTMATFALTAAVGTFGILFLYNNDVILAKHYLSAHDAGIYGGLNKIETIIYFGTLSVSQVLYPRVVEAIAKDAHPGRLLMLSAGVVLAMGAVAVLVFAAAPRLIVGILYGERFLDAARFMVPIGLIGLALSLNNLLVYFFMAAHDRVFMPILLAGVALEGVLIFLFHHSLAQVVSDVLSALVLLLGALVVRAVFLLPALRPEMVAEEGEAAVDP